MNRILLLFIICGFSIQGIAQSPVREILKEIEKNNPKLKTHQQLIKARELGIRSQTNLDNPEFEWEKSFSSEEGKPYEFLLSQSFDFPTSYLYKNQLKADRIANLSHSKAKVRQEVLLEAELLCFELIYQNKQYKELTKRLDNAKQLECFFSKKLKEGDASILELNKIRMLVLNTKNQLLLAQNRIANLKEDLKKQNGGLALNYKLLEEYPSMDIGQDIRTVMKHAVDSDPYLKELNLNEKMASKETSLVKTYSLPKISIGYRYLGSDRMKEANGMKLGISIPLWNNRNKVKQAKVMELYRKEVLELRKMEKLSEYEKLFQTFFNLKSSLEDYRQVFLEKKHITLLRKALDFGEISAIEYLTDSIYYYESFDTYLEIEHEYYSAQAQILRFKL